MNKISICFFVLLGVAVIFSPSENVYGEELIFDSESITEVDLEMALYDLKINYLNIWDINQRHPYGANLKFTQMYLLLILLWKEQQMKKEKRLKTFATYCLK